MGSGDVRRDREGTTSEHGKRHDQLVLEMGHQVLTVAEQKKPLDLDGILDKYDLQYNERVILGRFGHDAYQRYAASTKADKAFWDKAKPYRTAGYATGMVVGAAIPLALYAVASFTPLRDIITPEQDGYIVPVCLAFAGVLTATCIEEFFHSFTSLWARTKRVGEAFNHHAYRTLKKETTRHLDELR